VSRHDYEQSKRLSGASFYALIMAAMRVADTDNLEDMHKLHRRFGRRADWQGSWGRSFLEHVRRQEQRMGW
jgi:hypothetical protein